MADRPAAVRLARPGWRMLAPMLLGLLPLAGSAADTVSPVPAVGLPFTRSYSFEEIGNASRGARLGFDPLGRIAVMSTGSYSVLNDTTWIDLAEPSRTILMQRILFDHGQGYYGGAGNWGLVEESPEGKLQPRSLRPEKFPKWVLATTFVDIVPTSQGVYFGGFNGVIYWERATGKQSFFELQGVSRLLPIGDTVVACSLTQGLNLVDLEAGALRPIPIAGLDGTKVDQHTSIDRDRVLFSTFDGQMQLFDGQSVEPWPASSGDRPLGRITAMAKLADGNVAIAVVGKGLFLLSSDGHVRYSLTTPEYHRITDLATREPGVLWAATETGVEKILYQSPLTIFGQRLGLPVSWPQVVAWQDRVVVASGGRLYQSIPGTPGETTRFEPVPNQPARNIWGIAAKGPHLLVANSDGVYLRDTDGSFTTVIHGVDVTRLVMVGADLCYFIGANEIGVLQWANGRWTEIAPRIPGLGYPSVVHASARAVWIEMGANRVARVALKDGKLQARVFESFPWKAARWVNIGIIGDTIILSGVPDGRVYFDDAAENFVQAPALQQLFDQAPRSVARVRQDESGTIWASHDQGLYVMRPTPHGYQLDPTTFGTISDRFPLIQLLPNNDVWLSTGQSLYHVGRQFDHERAPNFHLTIVSVSDGRTQRQLMRAGEPAGLQSLAYGQNTLVFRVFSGSYASRQPPSYEFRLNRGGSNWSPLGDGSQLTLTDLREGTYRLDVRLTSPHEPAPGDTVAFEFEILPPWYRTAYAYALYFVAGTAAILGLMRWSAHRSRTRNVVLEKLVEERTEALRVAMAQLNEETRNAATLAERDRLAGEIHDSLQQGLSGLMLHLDATLKLADLPADVRSRLTLARNMVSFTRHEVQHAVWDMETPLLEDTELGDALKKLSELIGPGAAQLRVATAGTPVELSSATKHHLLRIAQEAITNAVRHSGARSIDVTLAYDSAGGVTLTVSDDGNGFVPSDVLTKGLGHFGLRGLRGRASKIGGELRIDSAPGRGTTVSIHVPTATPAYSHADYSG